MAPPRLLAIAPDGWDTDPHFHRCLAQFHAATLPLGDAAAVYLRAHGLSMAQWRAALDDLTRPNALRFGITLPIDARLPTDSAALAAIGVDFVHLTERDAQRPMAVDAPLHISRVCHDPRLAAKRLALGADWLVVSPIFATPSKPNATPLGLAGLAEAARLAPGRVLALGGVDAAVARACCVAGAAGVAIQRAAWTNAATLVTSLAGA